MGKPLELSGKRFGRLVAQSKAGLTRHNKMQWQCKCDCGKEPVVISSSLVNGNTQSCGCYHREVLIKVSTKHGYATRKKGRSKENNSWHMMMQRCLNPRLPDYHFYGGRGIKVCERWLGVNGFVNFLADVGFAPSPKHTIDRINNEGNYEPGNCRWATQKEQCNNRRPRRKRCVTA